MTALPSWKHGQWNSKKVKVEFDICCLSLVTPWQFICIVSMRARTTPLKKKKQKVCQPNEAKKPETQSRNPCKNTSPSDTPQDLGPVVPLELLLLDGKKDTLGQALYQQAMHFMYNWIALHSGMTKIEPFWPLLAGLDQTKTNPSPPTALHNRSWQGPLFSWWRFQSLGVWQVQLSFLNKFHQKFRDEFPCPHFLMIFKGTIYALYIFILQMCMSVHCSSISNFFTSMSGTVRLWARSSTVSTVAQVQMLWRVETPCVFPTCSIVAALCKLQPKVED